MAAACRKLDGGTVEMECGVEVFAPFAPEGEVQLLTTPGGAAACATHVGPVQRTLAPGIRLVNVLSPFLPRPRAAVYGSGD
jgi:hypothetical protein